MGWVLGLATLWFEMSTLCLESLTKIQITSIMHLRKVLVVGTPMEGTWCGVQLILSRLRTVLNTILSDRVSTLESLSLILAVVYAIVFFVGRRVAGAGGDTKPWVAFAIMIIVSIISLWSCLIYRNGSLSAAIDVLKRPKFIVIFILLVLFVVTATFQRGLHLCQFYNVLFARVLVFHHGDFH